jgi:hypothetical protein
MQGPEQFGTSHILGRVEVRVFIINATAKNCETKCLVFDSGTIARIISDKLERQGFEVEILDQSGEQSPGSPQIPTGGCWASIFEFKSLPGILSAPKTPNNSSVRATIYTKWTF